MTGSSPAPPAARAEPRTARRRSFPWSDVATTAAAFLLAFIVGALLMIVSDTEVRSKFTYFFARPSDALSASWDKVSSAYGALIRGALGGIGPIPPSAPWIRAPYALLTFSHEALSASEGRAKK